MKKLLAILILSVILISSSFSITILEKLLLPEYKGDLITGTYKVIENNGDVWIIEINGVTYIYKMN